MSPTVPYRTPVSRSRLADEVGAALMELSVLLRRAILPPQLSLTQARALLNLHSCGPQRVTSLAEDAQVTQPTMSALVIGMERLGWVRRDTPGGADRRVVSVCLTEAGRNMIGDLEAARSRALLADINSLPERDRAALAAALPALRGIISHEQGKAVAS
ncbi:MAG TPA: MarR family transcriptional regulator [Streptosporangiaceae bacterium]|jgi:DNA-binding MarR family transcriptional regulator